MIALNDFGVYTLQHPGREKVFNMSSPYGVIENANIYLKTQTARFKKKKKKKHRIQRKN